MNEGKTGFIELRDMRERLLFIGFRQVFRCFAKNFYAHRAAEWTILLIRFWRFSGTMEEMYKEFRLISNSYNVTDQDT